MASGTRGRKTTANDGDVEAFLASVPDERRRADAQEALALFREATGTEPRMWGRSIVGFGDVTYPGAGGRTSEWFAVGLAARKAALTLYGLTYDGSNAELLARLGPHTTGKGCLYVRRLADIDTDVLRELVGRAWAAADRGEE
ncbi:DUF1801 domain-containing protein [Phycicoccus avicenniae]|uniref:DUF1801 domain-containing protein n=1 Tax=Phycicoccus avicenniae TaxID=2828860 RepID=UPI003D2CD813